MEERGKGSKKKGGEGERVDEGMKEEKKEGMNK